MTAIKKAALAVSLSGVSGLALADVTTATAAITAAQTDALTIVGALTAMGVAIWGAWFIYRKFFGGK